MTDPSPSEDITVSNDRSLKKLAWAIEASQGQFKLILARSNYGSLRSRLVERLQELCSVEIRVLVLKESDTILYATIRAALGENMPAALMVLGLESVRDIEQMLTSSNQVREEFRKNLPFPLVLWVNDEVLKNWMRLASDFESWATTVTFLIAPEDLENQLRDTAEQWFTNNLTLSLDACLELEAAYKELLKDEGGLNPELAADCESLLGFAKRVNNQLDAAIEHYQRGLVFWQQTHNLERQAKLLDEIAFCYYLKAPHRFTNHPICQDIKDYVQEYLRVIEQIQRPDLMANSILRFGEVLGYLQDWEQLKRLAQQAVTQHEAENKPIELARDYGFLAEAALAQERWKEANQLAQKALDVLSVTSKIPSPGSSGVLYELPDKSVLLYDPSLYLFILAKSQQSLGHSPEAILNLEEARKVGSPECDPQLYLDILCYLQQLYFQEKDYLKAFEIKQKRQSIEQQYGLRAFIGAGRIKSQRQARLALKQVVETRTIASLQESVAPEITASGRQLDVERLIEKIARNDCKLIVIHGESGVGKSSLVTGGLVPALKQKAIGTSDVLPVLMRVYTSWVGELGRLLAEALEEKGSMTSPPTPLLQGEGSNTPPFPSREGGLGGLGLLLDSETAILEQLQQSESRNLRIVLIFDQFEEFFFVYPDPVQQRQFFEFVGECLNILPVKVILSLRQDYLHYLLECNYLDSMKIIGNDILTKNVLYSLGNFLPADAKSIIQRLTERSYFHLEPALIEELVQDLAGELGKVRPIELQIVGAQLQTENITTLVQYRSCGFQPKEELVDRYLAEVVEDCGPKNQQLAELVLYLLTDEKGTRPLKTRAELERDLHALAEDLAPEAAKLELLLKIFVESGLVFLLPEAPADRYQLVHDYLVAFIRQQQRAELLAKLAELRKREEHNQAEKAKEIKERNRRQARFTGGILVLSIMILWIGLYVTYRKARTTLLETARQNLTESAVRKGDNIQQSIDALKASLVSASQTVVLQSQSKNAYRRFIDQLTQELPTQIQCVQLSNLKTKVLVASTCGNQAIAPQPATLWPSQKNQLLSTRSEVYVTTLLPQQSQTPVTANTNRANSTNQLNLVLSAPVYNTAGQLQYTLSIQSALLKQYRTKPRSLSGYPVVINHKGIILAHIDPERVGRNIEREGDFGVLQESVSNASTGGASKPGSLHLFSFEKKGVELVAGYTSIPSPITAERNQKWTIFAITASNNALDGLKDIQQVLFILCVILSGGDVFVTLFLVRFLL